jgi:hypothetical protein
VWPPKIDLPGYRPVTKAHGKQIQAAAQLIAHAKKPVLYVGGGVIRARAGELRVLAERPAPRRHDADGARRVPRLAPAAPRHARACTARCPPCSRCRRPISSSRWAPASTTA